MNFPVRLIFAAALIAIVPVVARAVPGRPDADDEGLSINQTEALLFPFSMTTSGIHAGEARVVISVDANGQLSDALVVGYTNEAFAESAVRALKRWTYEPARAHGQPRASRVQVFFTFKSDLGAMVQSLPGMTDANLLRSGGDHYVFKACNLSDLDRIPIPAHVVPPAVPKAGLVGATRTVTVEFYIDLEGRVRVPAIGRDEPDDAYAAAAVSAVEQWKFEPPLRRGRPVLVLARQEFQFVPKP